MAEPLKAFFSPNLVERLADDIAKAFPRFQSRLFVKEATTGLAELELMARAKHIADALAAHLPSDYAKAIDILLKSLGPTHASDELLGVGMAPFFYLPHVLFVAERGLGHFDISMRAQYELTKRFSAETSIRPYIASEPERTFAVLRRWARDDNPHVRRLVSEGTRLRLPWAMRVAWLDKNPQRVLELLELLKDDPASVVRRSVANNLNDLGKVHPDLLYSTCKAWLSSADANRRALVKHALRSAIKRGEAPALALLGFGKKPRVAIIDTSIRPRSVKIGGHVDISCQVRSTAATAQDLLIDVRVHFVKKRGDTSPKVFTLARRRLPARGSTECTLRVSLAIHTTRKPNPGRHNVELLVNGVPFPAGSFNVTR